MQRLTFSFSLLLPTLLALSVSVCNHQPLQAVVGPGENPVQLRFAAMDALLHGNSKDSLDLYETAIQEAVKQYGESSSFLADLYYEAGTVALDSSQFPAAERYLTEAVRINPYSTMAKIKLAELYRLEDKSGEVSKQLRQAVQINPNSPVTRQAYIRWLATSNSPQENAIATQESLKLAMLNAHTSEIRPRDKGTVRPAPPVVLSPALIAPLAKVAPAPDKKAEALVKVDEKAKEAVSTNTVPKPKATNSLLNFRDVNKNSKNSSEKAKAEKDKAEKAKQEAAKLEAARKDAVVKEASARLAAAQREAQRESQRHRAAKAAKAAAPKAVKAQEKKTENEAVKKENSKKEVKQAEKVASPKAAETTESTEGKKAEIAKPAKAEKLAPNVVPSAQPMYQQMAQPMPQMMYQIPVMPQAQSKPKAGKRTMVPPPPPTMPMYQPMPQMMRPMPYPQQQQTPVKPKKPAPKPVKEETAEPEEKPAIINQSSEPDFLIQWGGGSSKKKEK